MIHRYCFPFLMIWLHLAFFLISARAGEPVVISTEEFPPFTSEKLKGNGIDCDLVREALRVSGMEVKFVFVPAARSLKMALVGEADASLPWAKRPGRDADFHFSDPVIAQDNEVFFLLKDTAFNWDPESRDFKRIAGKTVGGVLAYNYGPAFETAEKDKTINVERVTSDKINFDKLFAGRFDAVIAKRMVGQFLLKSNFTAEQQARVIQTSESRITTESDYLLISKKSTRAKEILQAVNTGLQELRRNGKYDAMIKAFHTGDYFTTAAAETPSDGSKK